MGVALIAFVALGLGDGATGVAWPSVADTFDRGISQLGVLIAVTTLGFLGGSAITGIVARRFGLGTVLTASTTLTAIGYVGYAAAPSWPVVVTT